MFLIQRAFHDSVKGSKSPLGPGSPGLAPGHGGEGRRAASPRRQVGLGGGRPTPVCESCSLAWAALCVARACTAHRRERGRGRRGSTARARAAWARARERVCTHSSGCPGGDPGPWERAPRVCVSAAGRPGPRLCVHVASGGEAFRTGAARPELAAAVSEVRRPLRAREETPLRAEEAECGAGPKTSLIRETH